MLSNAKLLIFPYLEELDKYSGKKQVADIVDIIRRHLYELLSPFATQLSTPDHRLTSTEIKVADMVVHDKSSKEIAAMLNISPKSVSHHRANIRKKLGLTNRKINLKTFLLSYQ